MYLDYTPEQWALQAELRAYFEAMMTPELEAEIAEHESGGPLYQAALEKMGADGWLGLGWPEKFGGQGRPPIEQFIFFDEVQRAGYPIPLLTLNTVGPTLMKFGSDAQKAEFLPKILAGTVHFSIGYTESSAGTDLAALKTRAEKDGDDYVINGQKVFTSLAHHADYIWLAVRTDPEARKHRGISMVMVPRHAEGVAIIPTPNLGDSNIFTVFFDNVRVPQTMRIGPENAGWKLITSQLNHERVSLFTAGIVERFLDEVTRWARETATPDGVRVMDQPWVQAHLARVHAGVDVLRLFNWRQAWNIARDDLSPQEASAVKVWGSEFYVEANRLLMEILGAIGTLRRGSEGAILQGKLERYYRATLVLTFGGGANEVQRDIICMAGLRMPRPPR